MNVEILKHLANIAFILACAGLCYTAMTMTNDVRWIWFMLFGLFAL